MLKNFWRAIRTPSLTRRLMLSQLALMVAIWSVLVVLIIRDIAYTDKWYQPRLMNNRATMILAVAESLQGRPVEQHTALARIWDGPESLPTPEEIAEPEVWIARVLPKGAASLA